MNDARSYLMQLAGAQPGQDSISDPLMPPGGPDAMKGRGRQTAALPGGVPQMASPTLNNFGDLPSQAQIMPYQQVTLKDGTVALYKNLPDGTMGPIVAILSSPKLPGAGTA